MDIYNFRRLSTGETGEENKLYSNNNKYNNDYNN